MRQLVACWVLKMTNVGKNFYEAYVACCWFVVACCLSVSGSRSRSRRRSNKDVRSNFSSDAAVTVGSGTAASTWARERYL